MTNTTETVSAAPTKQFFISVLIKDIQFIDAIVELVDNSVDSARSKIGEKGLRGLVIEIDYTSERFEIRDNAYGIPIEVAKHYAFRFGRPENAPTIPGAVGEFGVGMKRALFKIGRHFSVSSQTEREFFIVEVDVDEWESQPESDPNGWTFPLKEQGQNPRPKDTGTTIGVKKLYDYGTEELQSTTFGSRLLDSLKEAHQTALNDGLQITVNKVAVQAQLATVLSSPEICPICKDQELDISGKKVRVKLIAGVGDPVLADAGWYVYCNGRQIERADKTERTGWSSALDGGDQIPKPHWQFRRFRGFLFFESGSLDVLPWNTTKTGLNIEAPAYRRIRSDMNSAMLQVISFLNALDAEPEDGPLEASVQAAPRVSLTNLTANASFTYRPAMAPAPVRKQSRISYTADPAIVEIVKESLGVRTNREAGEQTFEYYIDNEGLNGG
jgi:hypothetical protein